MVLSYYVSCCLLLVALQSASSGTIRAKRQSDGDSDESLDDRYGFDRNPQFQGQWQNQFPGNNRFPDQQQFPGQNQFPGPSQFPGQNQFPRPGQWQGQNTGQGQNQFPGQGQQRFPNGQGQNQPSGQGQNQFPGQGQNQLPNQGQEQNQSPNQNAGGITTQSPAIKTCVRACPVTAEYNPVCGSNNVQYNNPSHLYCAQNCGINVSLLRTGACPAATTTAAPSS